MADSKEVLYKVEYERYLHKWCLSSYILRMTGTSAQEFARACHTVRQSTAPGKPFLGRGTYNNSMTTEPCNQGYVFGIGDLATTLSARYNAPSSYRSPS
eukprot:scaffold49582_cov75-Phaeocystis_antarctica.AAC.3